MRRFAGKRALLTGAASGIGRELALLLAAERTDLFLLDVDEAGLSIVAELARGAGVNVIVHPCDLSDRAAIDQAVTRLRSEWGQLDLLINNAGVAFYGPTETMTEAQWDWLLDINLMAPLHLTRQLLPMLLSQPDSHLVNMCSISGLVAGGRFAAYHVSKFGLVGFTHAMRAEFGRKGLGVTAICPGPSRTNLYESAISGKPDRPVPSPPAWVCATPEQIARATIKAIRRNRRMVLVTPLARILYFVDRFAPWLLDNLQRASGKRLRRWFFRDFVRVEDQRKAA